MNFLQTMPQFNPDGTPDPASGTAWGGQQGHARMLTNNLMYQGRLESPQGTVDAAGYTPPAQPMQGSMANKMALAMLNKAGAPQQGQMVGGQFVAPSPLSYANQMGAAMMPGLLGSR